MKLLTVPELQRDLRDYQARRQASVERTDPLVFQLQTSLATFDANNARNLLVQLTKEIEVMLRLNRAIKWAEEEIQRLEVSGSVTVH